MKKFRTSLVFFLVALFLHSCLAPQSNRVYRKKVNKVTVRGLEAPPEKEISGEQQTSFSILPSGQLKVLLALIDDSTGATKKVAHIIGEGNLDLSGIPDGTYTLLAETTARGFRPPPPQSISIRDEKFEDIELKFEQIDKNYFYYYWESDHEGREFEYSANDDVAPQIEFLGETIDTYQTTAAQTLQRKYNITLTDTTAGEGQWGYHLASKLLRAVDSLPHTKLKKRAVFSLTDKELLNDIEFVKQDGHYRVKINLNTFAYASEKMVKLNGKRGKFFSRRLFNALVRFFTNNGKKSDAVSKILEDKFAVTTTVNNYRKLTATNEPKENFQEFKPNELVKIINAFAEMPEGLYKISGLRYLLRRLDGHPHPLYPNAAAVAWPRGADNDSYIEFMDGTFIDQSESVAHRLILHEKAHFLWKNILGQQTRNDWIELGGWFENAKASSGWSTTQTTAFVSAYAHDINPNEDMAESIATYVLNPNRLLSRAPGKFEFIERRIMNGYRYVSAIREDLTFEVLNLFPDYDYPGKISRVEVEAKGNPHEDKVVTITLELMNKKGINDSARFAVTRIFSPNETFKDLYLNPVKGNGHLLRGTLTIPNTAKRGYWTIQNIKVVDNAKNERYEGIVDFGFKLHINNAVEDIIPPQYVSNSLAIQATEGEEQGRQVFFVNVQWEIDENIAMKARNPSYANMISLDHAHLYRITEYGRFNKNTKLAQVKFMLTEYHPPGRYGISYINMQDRALNKSGQYFSGNPDAEDPRPSDTSHEIIKYITIESRNPDENKPELNPEKITISAAPVYPEAPDGNTNVHVTFYARDDKSGLGLVYYRLLDPIGGSHFNYFYHSNTYTSFYHGDPAIYKKYDIKTTLPKGSPPGQWGLQEIVLHDKAGNANTYNFLEVIHFTLE